MNIFQLYVGQIHLFSLASVCLVIFIGMYLTRRHPIHIRTIMSLIVVLLGHYVYEDIFILIMGFTGRSKSAWWLFMLVTGFILSGLITLEKYYDYLNPDGLFYTFFLAMGVATCFEFMWINGWFHSLQNWYTGCGPDPHNLLWAISKVLGFAMFIPLLWERN